MRLRCGDCTLWMPWADGEKGECRLILPPYVAVRPGWTHVMGNPVTTQGDGCSLGTPKDHE